MPACLTFSTGSLYLYGLDRVFALATVAGFDGIEVMIDERLDTHQPDNLRRLMKTYGLPILSLHAPFVGRQMHGWQPGAVAYVEQAVTLAEQIGARHVVMHLPDNIGIAAIQYGQHRWIIPAPPLTRPLQRWLASGELARFQAGTAVKICVENLPPKSRKLMRWLPGVDAGRLTWWNTLETCPHVHDFLTLDTAHWAGHGVSPIEAYQAGGSRVRHIHLSNYRADVDHRLPHDGDLDLAGFLRHLMADDFDGQIVLELNPHSLGAEDSATARDRLLAAAAFCRDGLATPAAYNPCVAR